MQTRVVIREDRIVVVLRLTPGFKALSLPEQRRAVEIALGSVVDNYDRELRDGDTLTLEGELTVSVA